MEGLPEILPEPHALRRAYQAEIGAFLAEIRKGCQMVNLDYAREGLTCDIDVPLGAIEFVASPQLST